MAPNVKLSMPGDLQNFNLPKHAPVMVLPNALLFPNSLLPLRIFENRYQEMLAYALAHERMFCVALMKPEISEAIEVEDFYNIAGVGIIRACVQADDGTSNLVLQGIARVELINYVQKLPFRIAEIREVQSEIPNVIEAEALSAKVLELCRQLKEKGIELPAPVEKSITSNLNPEVISDVVSQAVVRDPLQRQNILEERFVSKRLRLLIQYLQAELG